MPEEPSEAGSADNNQHQLSISAFQTPGAASTMNAEPARSSDTALGKCKADAPINDGPEKKSRSCTCQKCSQKQCGGGANRKFCKNPCQDCGEMGCHGRNSQHPRKTCAVGWGFHHKELKL
jgi:hypothetical protein